MKRLLLLAGLAGCATPPAPVVPPPVAVIAPVTAPAPAVVVAAPVDAGPPPLTAQEVQDALSLNCQSCHSLAYIEQQRLTAGQWTATLTKMRGWGALLEESQVAPLSLALAATRGPTAALPVFETRDLPAFTVEAEPARTPALVEKGKALFLARCMVCHGPDAHGSIGVNLVDRPIQQEPTRFAQFVKSGRGRMPPHADLGPRQFKELLAFLRSL